VSVIRAEHLSKWYGQVIGINDISIEIGPGVSGFLGPNGAGKSTLIKVLTGQLKPSKGRATLWGEPIWNNHELNRRLGYCPERDVLYEHMSGADFLRCMLELSGFSGRAARERASETIRAVGMSEAGGKKIGAYSRGMRQRIKLAQAIAHDPELIFLDEPLAGMDALGRRQTIDLIKSWGNAGKTVVVSSHILHEVEEMTDTIILINHGRLVASGDIYEIRRLIDTHPTQVTIACDDPRRLTSKLLEFDDVFSVQFDREKGEVSILTTEAETFHERLPSLLLESGIRVYSIMSPDENLQSVFEYLVK